MAKKQKRQVSGTTSSTTTTARPAPTYTPSSAARRVASAAEFKPDYTHVYADLKRIGVLAAGFLVILVVLSFILH